LPSFGKEGGTRKKQYSPVCLRRIRVTGVFLRIFVVFLYRFIIQNRFLKIFFQKGKKPLDIKVALKFII
jgi:hypothetical protein